jgi:hypothetical protein
MMKVNDTITITAQIPAGSNFTPAQLIRDWARQQGHSWEYIYGELILSQDAGAYRYDHYNIQPGSNGTELVTVTLARRWTSPNV